MTIENTDPSNSATSTSEGADNVGGGQQTVAELQAEIARLSGESAKHRNLAKQAQKERDELKASKKSEVEENYKELWAKEQQKAQAILSKVKAADIKSAATAQLQKAGVRADVVDAAAKLLDANLIEWDEDNGTDRQSVVAAVQKLKGEFPFLFEKTVASADVKTPVDGTSSKKEVSREQFDRMSPTERMAKIKAGFAIID